MSPQPYRTKNNDNLGARKNDSSTNIHGNNGPDWNEVQRMVQRATDYLNSSTSTTLPIVQVASSESLPVWPRMQAKPLYNPYAALRKIDLDLKQENLYKSYTANEQPGQPSANSQGQMPPLPPKAQTQESRKPPLPLKQRQKNASSQQTGARKGILKQTTHAKTTKKTVTWLEQQQDQKPPLSRSQPSNISPKHSKKINGDSTLSPIPEAPKIAQEQAEIAQKQAIQAMEQFYPQIPRDNWLLISRPYPQSNTLLQPYPTIPIKSVPIKSVPGKHIPSVFKTLKKRKNWGEAGSSVISSPILSFKLGNQTFKDNNLTEIREALRNFYLAHKGKKDPVVSIKGLEAKDPHDFIKNIFARRLSSLNVLLKSTQPGVEQVMCPQCFSKERCGHIPQAQKEEAEKAQKKLDSTNIEKQKTENWFHKLFARLKNALKISRKTDNSQGQSYRAFERVDKEVPSIKRPLKAF